MSSSSGSDMSASPIPSLDPSLASPPATKKVKTGHITDLCEGADLEAVRIVTSDEQVFVVAGYYLKAGSKTFRDMLSMPQLSGEATTTVTEAAAKIKPLLYLLVYNRYDASKDKVIDMYTSTSERTRETELRGDRLRALFRLMDKYQCDSHDECIKAYLYTQIRNPLHDLSFPCLLLAINRRWLDVARACIKSFGHLSNPDIYHSDLLSVKHIQLLGMQGFIAYRQAFTDSGYKTSTTKTPWSKVAERFQLPVEGEQEGAGKLWAL